MSSFFDRASVELYVGIVSDLRRGQDVSRATSGLAARLGELLDATEDRARNDAAQLSVLALVKRVTYEIAHHLAQKAELDEAARDALGRLLGRTSFFQRLPHPRFRVTQDWFSNNAGTWNQVLRPLAGRPRTRALEIGSFEGMSACFLLEQVLTHETSSLVCIDPFDAPGQLQAERNFDFNIEATGQAHKVTKLKARSDQVLPFLAQAAFDLAYIDGSHAPADALRDALSVWPLLKPGAIVIFDDYELGASYPPEIAAAVDPKPGISAFLSFIAGQYEVLAQGYQLIIQRL
jgi:predicted O-methyltransferase YrrM